MQAQLSYNILAWPDLDGKGGRWVGGRKSLRSAFTAPRDLLFFPTRQASGHGTHTNARVWKENLETLLKETDQK